MNIVWNMNILLRRNWYFFWRFWTNFCYHLKNKNVQMNEQSIWQYFKVFFSCRSGAQMSTVTIADDHTAFAKKCPCNIHYLTILPNLSVIMVEVNICYNLTIATYLSILLQKEPIFSCQITLFTEPHRKRKL